MSVGGSFNGAEVRLELNIGTVEQMYRHLNLRDDPTDSTHATPWPGTVGTKGDSARATEMGDPVGFPDNPNNDARWLFFVHGYNVGGQAARGWHAEMFKRFYWSGSRARFVGVSWFGNPRTGNTNIVQGYHWAVRNAVPTAQALAAKLNPLDGSKTVVGHSLGCWVATSAVGQYGMNVANLCLVDAAFARECFDGDGGIDTGNMVPATWQDYPAALWTANWHRAFWDNGAPSSDARSTLTWRNRLAPALERTAVHSFYSSTEDVLERYAGDPNQAIVDNAFHALANLDSAELGRYAWVVQEKSKGNMALFTQGSGYMGWGFNVNDPITSNLPKWYVPDTYNGLRRVKTPGEIGPVTTQMLSDIKIQPLFKTGWGTYFAADPAREVVDTDPERNTGPAWIFDLYGVTSGNTIARDPVKHTELLAEAMPAVSLPVGANESGRLPDARQYDMPVRFTKNWPRGNREGTDTPDWKHSDVRDVAHLYLHALFDRLASISNQ